MMIPKVAMTGADIVRALAVELDAEAAAVPSARRQVSEALADWGLPSLVDDMALLVSELVANAVQHADGPVTLILRQLGRTVLLEVRDSSPKPPVPGQPSAQDAEAGRGLQLIAAIANEWGYHARPGAPGKTVWCSLSAADLTVHTAAPVMEVAS